MMFILLKEKVQRKTVSSVCSAEEEKSEILRPRKVSSIPNSKSCSDLYGFKKKNIIIIFHFSTVLCLVTIIPSNN